MELQKDAVNAKQVHDHGYSGLSAELYEVWLGKHAADDQAFFKRHLEKEGGLALEVGSGTGRLLIPFLLDGLHVHGIESSVDMSAICSSKASRHNINPTVYRQHMEVINIPVAYRAVFVPLCLFQSITKRDVAFETLRRFHVHLEKGGLLLITLAAPARRLAHHVDGMWRVRSNTVRPGDNAQIVLSEAASYNAFDQVETQWLKYETFNQEGVLESFIKTTSLRWYYKYEFIMMLEQAGFKDIRIYGDYQDSAATEKSDTFIFSARKQ